MKRAHLSALADITNLQLELSQNALASLLSEERRLRAMLADLSRDVERGQKTLLSDDSYKAIRGDHNWNQWVGRSRLALNLKLAKLLARKELAIKEAKKAFGKAEVLNKLVDDDKMDRKFLCERASLDALIDPMMLR
ncbi:hypothetical protein [Shimia sp.]|uniref:hypothetical protein n=1 Tax=Shimia sp. TaxID=1954381 RepID=UPI00329A7419